MQTTRHLHHLIRKVGFGIPKHILHNTAPFDTSDDVFNKNTNACYHRVLGFFFVSEFLALRFFLRLIGINMIRFVPLKSCILEEPAGGKLVIFFITNAFVVDTPTVGAAQVLHAAIVYIDKEVIFDRMRFFLPL